MSTGASVGMWAERLWCGQGRGLEYIWGNEEAGEF